MSKSGLYAHFASKQELQLATIDHFWRVFEEQVLHGGPDGPPEPGLAGLLKRWLAFYERRAFPGGCFIITSAVEFAARPGPVRDALEAALDREVLALETEIQRAVESGELRGVSDSGQLAFELHSILMETHALFQVKRDPAVFDNARAAMQRLVEGTAERGSR